MPTEGPVLLCATHSSVVDVSHAYPMMAAALYARDEAETYL